ncbi:MAG: CHAP domain-containing protein [Ruminococcaceae bacterium]|nr:CHAP domain-containing protein [Oscillospiraceae bacterium]
MKKVLKSFLICLIVCSLFLTILPIPVLAVKNVYPQYQTVYGVTTIRCTYYVWQQVYDTLGVAMPNFGDAKNWLDSAARNGYRTGSVAKANSIAVYQGGSYGHVAFVTKVNGSKMTINEGGMLNESQTAALNGTGIRTGATVNSTVGNKKDSYSSYILLGFIYFTESSSGGTHTHNYTIHEKEAAHPHKYYKKCSCGDYYYTGETAVISTCAACKSVSITSNTSKNTVSDNNAVVHFNVSKPSSYAVTKIGIRVRKDGTTYKDGWSHYQAPTYGNYSEKDNVPGTWDFKNEVKFTPTHLTKYYYQFYAVVNGEEYWSSEFSITTTGSHSYGNWSTTKAATCTAAGSKTRKCTGCTKTETASISALGHNYSSSYTVDKAATCTAAGSKSKHCTRCSAKTSVTAIAATGHSYGAWSTTKAATCIAEGSKTRKCSVCSATDTQAISALGHNYSSSWTIDKSANCTVAGSKSHHCSRCNAKSSITTVSSLGHSWSEWTVTQEATVDSAGKKTRKCTRNGCSKTETVTIAKLAADGHTHTFGEWKTTAQETCTTDGSQQRICSICKQIEEQTISATGHTFSMWTIINEATVDSEGLAVRKCGVCEIKEEETIPKIVSDAQKNTSAKKTDNRGKWSLPLMLNILAAVIAVSGVVVAIILLKGKLVKKKK